MVNLDSNRELEIQHARRANELLKPTSWWASGSSTQVSLMYERFGRNFSRAADSLSDDASNPDPFSRWGNGVGFASIPLIAGLASIIYQSSYFLGRERGLSLVHYDGKDAVALGIGYVAIALFMHGHYFWSVSDRYYFVSQILKPLSMLALAGSFGYVVVRTIMFT